MKSLIIITVLYFSTGYFVNGEFDLQSAQIPNVDITHLTAIREKCDKAGGEGTYDKLIESQEALQTCVTQFANITLVKDEIREAKKTGSMDEVFGKYCAKRSKLASCVQSFTNNLRPCLNNEENKALNITLEILKQLGEFVCYKDGDRLAMFIAEGGVECIQSHTTGIQECVNSTFKITPSLVNTNSLPNLLMDKKKCDDLGKLQHCVVEELEKCQDSTPANIIDALFKFVKRSACTNKNKRSVHHHSLFKRSVAYVNATEMTNGFLNIFKDKCAENAPDGGYEAFTLTFESASHCVRNKTRKNARYVAPVNNFKDDIKRCVSKLIEKTEACLPDDEKYWPGFYLEVILNVIDFAYANADVLSGTPSPEFINCFQNFKQQESKTELLQCIKVPENTTLHKDVFCGEMYNVKNCVYEQMKKRCVRDISLDKLFNSFFAALIAPCNKKGKN